MQKNLPNFVVVGAAKCGTTALFEYLNQCPEIFIPKRKECRFFSEMPGDFVGGAAADFQNDTIKTIEEYKELFAVSNALYKGDISNDYLYYHDRAIANIKKYLGDGVKIVLILRNPVDRAYSNYNHAVRLGSEPLSFMDALEAESARIKNNYAWPFYYIDVGLYYKQVRAYLDNFCNIELCFYDKHKENINMMFYEIYKFIVPDGVYNFNNVVSNQSYVYRKTNMSKLLMSRPVRYFSSKNFFHVANLNKMRKCLLESYKVKPEPLSYDIKKIIYNKYFYDDVENLEQYLGRSLEFLKCS